MSHANFFSSLFLSSLLLASLTIIIIFLTTPARYRELETGSDLFSLAGLFRINAVFLINIGLDEVAMFQSIAFFLLCVCFYLTCCIYLYTYLYKYLHGWKTPCWYNGALWVFLPNICIHIIYLPTYLPIYLSNYPSIHPSILPSIHIMYINTRIQKSMSVCVCLHVWVCMGTTCAALASIPSFLVPSAPPPPPPPPPLNSRQVGSGARRGSVCGEDQQELTWICHYQGFSFSLFLPPSFALHSSGSGFPPSAPFPFPLRIFHFLREFLLLFC